MALKQDIVVVNEYTVKGDNGKGSRGSTPGWYVGQYTVRSAAIEPTAPVQFDAEAYILRYVARRDATERAHEITEIKPAFKTIQGKGGVAFANGDPSLSHKKLKQISKDIQQMFDNGKTILKTIVSFTESYLREMGIVSEDFVYQGRGSYRGHIDQMKLRLGVMNGMRALGSLYDDLKYVGAIQVDTGNVHVHLTMVDAGRGYMMNDGKQKGTLSQVAKTRIIRGIDNHLRSRLPHKHLSAEVAKERANVKSFVKRRASEMIKERSFLQGIMACLPEDRSKWRASTNRKEMRNANGMVRAYVEELFRDASSGYDESMKSIIAYADERTMREGLKLAQRQKLIDTGRARLVKECINGVYRVLKDIPKEDLVIRTKTLDALAVDYDDLKRSKRDDPFLDVAYKLRTYGGRITYHRDEAVSYRKGIEDFMQEQALGQVAPEAVALLKFYEEEAEYHLKCLAKYQHFMNFTPEPPWLEEMLGEYQSRIKEIETLSKLSNDYSLQNLPPSLAENLGQERYGISGGRYGGTVIAKGWLEQAIKNHNEQTLSFERGLQLSGFKLMRGKIIRKPAYDFEAVKALDLHHLAYDFPTGTVVSEKNIAAFTEITDKRYTALMGAVDYLKNTKQFNPIENFPITDVMRMKELALKLGGNPELYRDAATDISPKPALTFTLDEDHQTLVKAAVMKILKNPNTARELNL